MYMEDFVRIHCFLARNFNNTEDKLQLPLVLRSLVSVLGYRDFVHEIGKFCPLPEPIRLLDFQDTARSEKSTVLSHSSY